MQSDLFIKAELISEIIDYANKKNVLVSKDLAYFLAKNDYKKILDIASERNVLFLDEKKVEEINKELYLKKEVVVLNRVKRKLAKEYSPNFKIYEESHVTGKNTCTGKAEDFHNYLKERFENLSKILKKRPNLSPIANSNAIRYVPKGSDLDIIAMLYDKRETKNGNLLLQFEDLHNSFNVIVSKDNKALYEEARKMLHDDVVAIKARKISDSLLIANEILYPDLPVYAPKTADIDLELLMTSDIHIGSNLFFGKEFKNFIDWLKKADKVKYITLTGDLVDGIGVYPQQDKELAIKDIYEQYSILAKYLSEIPEHIEVFVLPGNHDAVRRADPQPAIDKRYLKEIASYSNIHLVGSPCMVEIESLKVLMYHGNSFNDIQAKASLPFDKPLPVMEAVLKRRDLCPIFGFKNPVSPDLGGYLQIKEEPDIFITGHLHSNGYGSYKKTFTINPGTWQDQTIFQKQQGHMPTPGKVPIMNLKTGRISEKLFIK